MLLTAAENSQKQDCGLILHDGARVVICVAYGAGGLSGGSEAAILAVNMGRQNASLLVNADACSELMRNPLYATWHKSVHKWPRGWPFLSKLLESKVDESLDP